MAKKVKKKLLTSNLSPQSRNPCHANGPKRAHAKKALVKSQHSSPKIPMSLRSLNVDHKGQKVVYSSTFMIKLVETGKSLTQPVLSFDSRLYSPRFSVQALFQSSSSTNSKSVLIFQIQLLSHETHKTHFPPLQHPHKDPKIRASNQ